VTSRPMALPIFTALQPSKQAGQRQHAGRSPPPRNQGPEQTQSQATGFSPWVKQPSLNTVHALSSWGAHVAQAAEAHDAQLHALLVQAVVP
jgi:hypothetical protein